MGRRKFAASDEDSNATVDISPLIDCVFILLIFFIVTTSFVSESGIQVEKPEAAAAPSEGEGESVMLIVTERREVMYEGADIGISGIRPLVRKALRNDSEVPVVVQPEANTPAGLMVQVIDECRLGGAKAVSISAPKKGGG